MKLADLSNEQLLCRLDALVTHGRRMLARLLAYLGEVEERRLDLEAACSSLFDFCVRRLGMSEGEAFRRMTAARLARRFPAVLSWIEQGRIHLSALVLLRDHLTEDNHEELLREASGKTKRELQELLVARSSRQAAPSWGGELSNQGAPLSTATGAQTILSAGDVPSAAAHREGRGSTSPPRSATPSVVPLLASPELRDKITRATELMRHQNPRGELAVVLERGLDLLIAELERQKFGKTKRARAKDRADEPKSALAGAPGERGTPLGRRESTAEPKKPTRSGYIPRAVRREVYERDGGQCTFVDESGRRCPSRSFLEYDHIQPKALGGTGEASNVRLLCRPHNALFAERAFGREHIDRRIHFRQRTCGTLVAGAGAAGVVAADGALEHGSPAPRRREALEMLDVAARALKNLGFRDAEARRAIGVVHSRLDASAAGLSLEGLVRDALAVLT